MHKIVDVAQKAFLSLKELALRQLVAVLFGYL